MKKACGWCGFYKEGEMRPKSGEWYWMRHMNPRLGPGTWEMVFVDASNRKEVRYYPHSEVETARLDYDEVIDSCNYDRYEWRRIKRPKDFCP